VARLSPIPSDAAGDGVQPLPLARDGPGAARGRGATARSAVQLWIAPWRLPDPFAPPSRPQRILLLGLLAAALLFGAVVELRSAFLSRRMGDLPIFLRGAWAASTGADLYAVTDHNGWHYNYPPLLALLLAPVGEPPPDVGAPPVPYPVVVALWYGLNLLALALGVHVLASALESRSGDTRVRHLPRGAQRWWSLRIAPVLICLPAIGGTLARGQINLLVLACLCAMCAAAVQARRLRAGVWLALAACLKVLPAVLILYPLRRRDRRWLAGSAAGALLGLLVVPALTVGPARTLPLAERWAGAVLLPAFGLAADDSRSAELLAMTNNDNQSPMAAAHNVLLSATPRALRPAAPHTAARAVHWIAAVALIAATLACSACAAALREAILLGLWCLVMVLVSPASHLHYFAFAVPLVMALFAAALEPQAPRALRRACTGIAVLYPVALGLPHLPGLEALRHGGLAAGATIALWMVGLCVLRTRLGRVE
jgi:alpha-1,2-mannosyltransferase